MSFSTSRATTSQPAAGFLQFLQRLTCEHLKIFALLLISGIAALVLNLRFNSLGLLDQYNVIFDADPNRIHDNNWTHPLTHAIFYCVIKPIAVFANSLAGFDKALVAIIVSVHVIPPCMVMLRTFFVYRTVKLLTGNSSSALLVGLLSTFSFATLIFGAINDSYVVSGAVVSALIFYTVRIITGSTSSKDWFALVLSCVLAIGATSSNVIFVGWMLWVIFRKFNYGYLNSLGRSIVCAAVLLFVVILLGLPLSIIRNGVSSGVQQYARHVSEYVPESQEQLSNICRFPENIARSIIPTHPMYIPARDMGPVYFPGEKRTLRNQLIPYELTYNRSPVNRWSCVLWLFGALVLMLSNSHWPAMRSSKDFSRACGLTAITTGIVFSLFGLTTFLFATYWQIGSILLLGRSVCYLSQTKKGTVIAAILLVGLAASDIFVIADFLEVLQNCPINPEVSRRHVLCNL